LSAKYDDDNKRGGPVVTSLLRAVACLFLISALAACGGGEQEEAQEQSAPLAAVRPKPPNGATPIVATLTEGDQLAVQSTVTSFLRGKASLSGLDGIAVAGSESIVALKNHQFRVTFTIAPTLLPGTHQGNVSFNVCAAVRRDGSCKTLAKGSPILIAYTLTVVAKPATPWNTFQGDERHSGYVPVTLSPANFSKAWEWTHPAGSRITAATIENGRVAFSDDKYFAEQVTYVINKTNAAPIWSHNFGYIFGLNPPALKDNVLYVAATGQSQDAFLYAFDALTGTQKFKSPFGAQWEHYLAPTVADGSVLTNGGTYGGVYSFSTTSGAQQWFAAGPQEAMLTPAVTPTDAFYYSYGSLIDVDRATGAVKFSIADPQFVLCCYTQIAAPIVGTGGKNVIALSGDQVSGVSSSSEGGYRARALINFDLDQRNIAWRTTKAYITHPALAHSTLFAGTLDAPSLDAIGESDGAVKWSWTPTSGDTKFCRNVVATKNLIFASTDVALYAIDINTRQQVWSAPYPGDIALDGDMLVVSVGCKTSTGKLVGFKLR
jgi:outer membrane protein assembly factor BamB